MDSSRVGEAAGELWKRLAQKGSLLLRSVPKTAGLDQALVHMAIGWLAREGKVLFEQRGGDLFVSLTEEELKKGGPS